MKSATIVWSPTVTSPGTGSLGVRSWRPETFAIAAGPGCGVFGLTPCAGISMYAASEARGGCGR